MSDKTDIKSMTLPELEAFYDRSIGRKEVPCQTDL